MRAYRCDLCNKFTDYVKKVDGLDFKIGERHDEFTGTHDEMKEVEEICKSCHERILITVKEIYNNATTEK